MAGLGGSNLMQIQIKNMGLLDLNKIYRMLDYA